MSRFFDSHFLGGRMKLRQKTVLVSVFSLLVSCGGTERSVAEQRPSRDAQIEQARVNEETPTVVAEEVQTGNATTVEDLSDTTIIDEIPSQETTVAAPMEVLPVHSRRSGFLAGVHDVHPMQANHVGSYGLLPSRVAKDGPFLYSLPVDPKPHDWRGRRHSDDD